MTATTAPPPPNAPTREAVMSQRSGENFPVALWLLGARRRAQLLAIYGFARMADDAGDEATGDRSALLHWIEQDLDRIYAGQTPEHSVNKALAPVIRELGLPDDPFRRLIEANRRDQEVVHYASFDGLLDYCQLSAAPVGELVLRVFGAATPDRVAMSDKICAGLQVTEHLQDVGEDRARGRVYLPVADLERFGCTDEDLRAPQASLRLAELIRFEVGRARGLLSEGAPLIRTLPPRPRLAVAGFVAGGRAALDAIATSGYDVLGRRLRPTRPAFAKQFARTLRWA
jgi:squalene synthase HpnC